ncbi:MAG: hypothetical protein AVDCRST_MAG40-3032, partial [uncultured Gemmatimonadaceae bacterium]
DHLRSPPARRRPGGAAGRPLRRRARAHRGAVRAARRRGLRGELDARREPHEVAPRAYELVLRDVRARAARPRLRADRRALRLLVQLVLRAGGGAALPRAARARHAPHGRGGLRLPGARGRARAAPPRARGRRPRAPGARGRRAGAAPRAAAPGAAAHRHQARLLDEPDASRVPAAPPRGGRGAARARVARARGRGVPDRPRGRRLLLRQRGARAPGVPRAVPARVAAHDERRVPGVRGGRRLPAHRALAVRRLGHGAGRPVGGAALLGAFGPRLGRVHARRHPPARRRRAGVPRELLRGRRLRPLGRPAPPHRGGVGGRRRRGPGGGELRRGAALPSRD